jgi:hypothetical protein
MRRTRGAVDDIIGALSSILPVVVFTAIVGGIMAASDKIKEWIPVDKVRSYKKELIPPSPPRPKLNIHKYLLHTWQFWLIVFILLLSIVFGIITDSESNVVGVGNTGNVAVTESASGVVLTSLANVTSNSANEDMAYFVEGIVNIVPILSILLAVGFVINIFLKIGKKLIDR